MRDTFQISTWRGAHNFNASLNESLHDEISQ